MGYDKIMVTFHCPLSRDRSFAIAPATLFRAVICVLAAVCLAGLAACRETEPPPRAAAFDKPLYRWGTVTGRAITIQGNTVDLNRPYLLRAFKRYEALTGNTIRLKPSSHQAMAVELPAVFTRGEGERPDVLLSYGGVNIENLDPDANFYDFTHAPWVDDLTDTALNQTIYHGKVLGLPYWEASVSGTLYNKDVFRRYDLAEPRTQDEFFAACDALLRKGVIPLYIPWAEPSMMLYQFPMDCVVRDDRVLEALNEGALAYADIPAMRNIVSWYRTMAERGYFGHDYEHNDWAGMDEAMRSGRYAMLLAWDTWLYTDFTGDPSRFGLMPAFMGEPEEGTFEGPNLALLLVDKKSPNLDAALDLVAFLADPYNYNEAFAGLYTAPVFKKQVGSLATPQYVESEQRIESLFHDSTAWLRVRGFSQLDAVYIQKHVRDAAYTVEDCLKDMDAARRKRAKATISVLNQPGNEEEGLAAQ